MTLIELGGLEHEDAANIVALVARLHTSADPMVRPLGRSLVYRVLVELAWMAGEREIALRLDEMHLASNERSRRPLKIVPFTDEEGERLKKTG